MKKEQWVDGIRYEVDFWSAWVENRGGIWSRDFTDRLDPELPLRDRLHELVSGIEGDNISILDCGVGPLTILGKVRTSIPRTINENFSHLISMGYQ
ncbi:hypothetical protein ACK3YJ_09950 [Aeromonas caviae]|uniref:hypothetical protein n=1 Tax=Aeromonas caviae TaxID=648 RepID=UPI0038D11D21